MSLGIISAHAVIGGGGLTAYPTAVLARSPFLYWRFGESVGTVAADASGNANAGTYSGSPTLGTTGLLTADPDKSVTFTGNNLAFRASTVQTVFSAVALIKPSTVATGSHTIASRLDSTASAWTFRLEGTTLKFYYWNASNVLQSAIVASTVFAVSTKYHVAVVYTAGGSAFIYVNGAQVATAAVTTLNAVAATLRVGASGNATEFYSGVVDEFSYHTTALTAADIAALYAAT